VGLPELLADHLLAVEVAERQRGLVGLDHGSVRFQQAGELVGVVEHRLEPALPLSALGDVVERRQRRRLGPVLDSGDAEVDRSRFAACSDHFDIVALRRLFALDPLSVPAGDQLAVLRRDHVLERPAE
jgi:hypothetical protein